MARSTHARQTAITLISVGLLGLALVLGLWQQVDRACLAEGDPAAGALADCAPVPLADDEQPPPAPASGAVPVRTVAN